MYAHNAQSSKDLAWALKSFSCVLLKWLLVSWSSGKISDNSLSQNLEAKYIVFFLCHIPTFFCQREVCFHCRNRCEICIGTFALGGVGQALKQTWWTSRVGPYDFRDAENMDGLLDFLFNVECHRIWMKKYSSAVQSDIAVWTIVSMVTNCYSFIKHRI